MSIDARDTDASDGMLEDTSPDEPPDADTPDEALEDDAPADAPDADASDDAPDADSPGDGDGDDVDDSLIAIQVTPPVATLGGCESPPPWTVSLTAIGYLPDGSTLDVTDVATWVSSDDAVATVAAGGVVSSDGWYPGVVEITATVGTVTSSPTVVTVVAGDCLTSVEVSPATATIHPAQRLVLHATAVYSSGRRVDVTDSATWTSSDESTVSIDAHGVAMGVSVSGPVVITASFGTVSGTAWVSVGGGIVTMVQVTPAAPAAVCPGGTQSFTATAVYADASTDDVTEDPRLTWDSSDPAVAAISNDAGSQGVATGVAVGTTVITAHYFIYSFDITSAGVPFSVSAGVLDSIAVAPSAATVAVGSSVPLTATAHDSCGGDFDVTNEPSCVWTSSDAAVATVSNGSSPPYVGGTVTGIAPGGPVTISAAVAGLNGAASVTVVP